MGSFFIGHNLIKLESVDSTNNYAAKLLNQKDVAEGTAILAYEQFAGRGQRGSNWESQKGLNLTFSIILTPKALPISSSYIINKAVCLAIRDYVERELELKTQIKWPNDIYVSHKKIAGILIENTLRANYIQTTIVGIGLNVAQLSFKSSELATSMKLMRPAKNFTTEECFKSLCKHLEHRYLQYRLGKEQRIRSDYLSHLFQLGEYHPYIYKKELITAKIVNVSKDGRILLIDTYGNKISAENKEIVFC